MEKYKIFKKSDSFLKFLTPVNGDSQLRVAKLVTESAPIIIGYNDNEEKFIEINTCPRIYIGMHLNCKNVKTKEKEYLGKLIDLEFREGVGYLFIFEKHESKTIEEN